MKFLLLLLPFLLLGDTHAEEYRLRIEATVTIERVDGTDPAPEPEPDPIDPLALTIDVGPGKAFADLADIPIAAIQPKTTINLHAKSEPYKSKFGITQSGVQIIGIPGPAGEKPVISGDGARTHAAFPFGTALQSVSILCISGDDCKVKGIDFRDCWETDRFTNSAGAQIAYGGGAAAIRVHEASRLTIEDCHFTECIHPVFAKGMSKPVRDLVISNCVMTNCGNDTGQRDEVLYLETHSSKLVNVTIKDNRNNGTTCLHSRGNKEILIGCHFEGGGLLVYTDSVSEKDSPVLVNGSTPDGFAEINGGTFISRSASPFFTLRSDIGPDIAIRKLTVNGATVVGIGDQKNRFRRTIGTPTFDGNEIIYTNCTFGLLPSTEGALATALEFNDGFTKGIITIGPGNKEFIYERAGEINGTDEVRPMNWRDLLEVHSQAYQQLVDRFLKPLNN